MLPIVIALALSSLSPTGTPVRTFYSPTDHAPTNGAVSHVDEVRCTESAGAIVCDCDELDGEEYDACVDASGF